MANLKTARQGLRDAFGSARGVFQNWISDDNGSYAIATAPLTAVGSSSSVVDGTLPVTTTPTRLQPVGSTSVCAEVLLQNDIGSTHDVLVSYPGGDDKILHPGDRYYFQTPSPSFVVVSTATGTATVNWIARSATGAVVTGVTTSLVNLAPNICNDVVITSDRFNTANLIVGGTGGLILLRPGQSEIFTVNNSNLLYVKEATSVAAQTYSYVCRSAQGALISGGGGSSSITSITLGGNAAIVNSDGSLKVQQGNLTAALDTVTVGAITAGSSIIGKVTTDQTTHGTTDLVAADIVKVGGSALAIGPAAKANSFPVAMATDQWPVAVSSETSTVYNGTTALTPVSVKIALSASGATTIVALVAAKKIRILAMSLVANAAVNVNVQSHTTTATAGGIWYFNANGGIVLPFSPVGWFDTVAGEALDFNLSGTVNVGGTITYVAV